MTTIPAHASHHYSRTQLLPLGAAASVIGLLIMIPGYSDNGSFQAGAWTAILVVSLILSMLLFYFVVPAGGPVIGVIVGVVALVSVVVFWAGLTLPLAAAAGMIGWQWLSSDRNRMAWAALALAGISTVALVAVVIGDAVSN